MDVPSPIQHEVVIEAPISLVWRIVTEEHQIAKWFADRVELDARPGGHGRFVFTNADGDIAQIAPIVVEAIDPPRLFSFRWCHPEDEDPHVGNSLLVEFTLVAESAERTRLRVVEHGLDSLRWSRSEKDRYRQEHRAGWSQFVGRLAQVARAMQAPPADDPGQTIERIKP